MAVFSYAKKKKTNKYIKKLKSILGFVLAIVIIVSASYIYADSYDNPYEITAYNVDITVAEDNSLHVKETITAYFNTSKHGIIRTIPLRGTLSRDDGNQSNYTAKVSNISINEKYSKSTTTDGSYLLELTIGDPSRTITGEKTYVIEYDYKYNIRNIKEYDELYYNIIGPDWDTTIDNVTFSIAMPKEFDESKLGFTYGRVNEDLTGNVEYEVNGNIVTGRLNEILEPSNAFTVRLELPEGYFSELVDYDYYYQLGCIAIFVLVIVATVIMWFKFGKDKPLVETVEFYPPDNLNSLEIGFAQKAYVTSEDITSLLIYLANKGYLKIDEFEDTNQIFNTQSFKITKLKEYDGDNENERIFFNGLFKKDDEVTLSDLKYSFYTTQNRIARNINSKENKDKIIDKLSSKAQKITSIFIAITFFVISLYYVYAVSLPIFPVILFPLIFMYMMYMVIKSIISCFTSKKINSIITGIILCIVIFSMMSVFLRFFLFEFGRLYVEDYILMGIGIVTVIVLSMLKNIMPSRTQYGREILGKINGFKRFLENARKDELEQLVNDNPTYFYDILPYTYVLGVSKEWISKFEVINVEPPTWYGSATVFNVATFGSSINNAFSSTNSAMSSSPSSSSGGGSSGGGHSGGGAGGGGGRSW